MLKISFACCSSHLGTNNHILMFVRRAETRFWNDIVHGSCGYLWYGQVLGDYVDYVLSTQLLFCSWLNVVVIELFAIHCTRYISCVVQHLPILPAMIVTGLTIMSMNNKWFNLEQGISCTLPYILCSYLYVDRVMCSESGLLPQVGGRKKKFPSGMCCGSGVMLQLGEEKKRMKM